MTHGTNSVNGHGSKQWARWRPFPIVPVVCGVVILAVAMIGCHSDFSHTRTGRLIAAIERNDLQEVKRLAQYKEVVNGARWDGDMHTPLIEACRLGNREAVAILLASGADTGIRDHDGWTALMWAKQSPDSSEIGAMLRAAGAKE